MRKTKGGRMLPLTKEEIRELYKERDEALFFDYKPIKAKRIFIKPNKVILDKPPEVFNHFIKVRSFLSNYNCIQKNSRPKSSSWARMSSKQVVIKTLSNLDEFGAKNALSYVIRNSDSHYATTQDGEQKTLNEIMNEWSKDFTHKKNAKEVMHLAFCIDEQNVNYNDIRLKNAVDMVMQKNFYLYKYAVVIHTHQNKLHAHILLNKNNILDGQKFHLSRAEFKPFFNQLRNDFAMSLRTQNLEYHNHYKLENDLSKVQDEIQKNNFISKINVLDELTKLEVDIRKKLKSKDKKIEVLNQEMQKCYERERECIRGMREISNKIRNNEKQKKFQKGLKAQMDELNEKFQALKADKKRIEMDRIILYKETKNLASDLEKFEKQKWELRHEQEQEFSNLLQKKKYLDFITNLDRKTLTKSELNLKISAIQRDIILSESGASEMIRQRVKSSLMTSSLLGIKNNAFTLIKAHNELQTNLFMLKECGANIQNEVWESDEDKDRASSYLKNYQEQLEKNQAVLFDLVNQRFLLLQTQIGGKKQGNKQIKFYEVKEFEKISKFLNKDNAKEIQELYELANDKKGGGTGQTHTQGGGKAQEQETKAQEQTKQAQTQNTQNSQENTINETQRTQNPTQSQNSQHTQKENQSQTMQNTGFYSKR